MTCVLGGGCATSPASERESGRVGGGGAGGAGHVCSLWQTGQKQGPGEGWGHRAGAHGFFWQRTEPSWGREATLPLPMSSHPQPGHTRPHGGVPLLTCPAQTPSLSSEGLSPICPDGCHRQRVPWEEETTSFWPERRIKG